MRTRTVILAAVGSACVLGGAAWADTLYLKDGRVPHGQAVSAAGSPVVQVEMPVTTGQFPAETISRIEKGAPEVGPRTQPAGGRPAATTRPAEAADARAAFTETRRLAGQVDSGPVGLMIWQEFLKEHPSGPLTDLARKELAVWKQRAEKNLVRFGPEWMEAAKATERLALAEALFDRARHAEGPDAAAALLTQAARAHPYRIDIPFYKAARCYRAKRLREFGRALGEVLKIEPNHTAARNNLGVLAVDSKDWARAIACLTKAAGPADNDAVLDNLDQVIALAETDGFARPTLAAARVVARKTVAAMQRAGRHAGQARWGGTWVTQQQHNTYVAVNAYLDKEIGQLKGKLANLAQMHRKANQIVDNYGRDRHRLHAKIRDARGRKERREHQRKLKELDERRDKAQEAIGQIEEEAGKLKEQIVELAAKKHVPPLPRRLVLLGIDGQTELDVLLLDRKEDDGDGPGKDRKPRPPKPPEPPDPPREPIAEPTHG